MNQERRASAHTVDARHAVVAAALTVGVCVLALVALAAEVTGAPPATFTRDVAASAGVAWYAGSVSILNLVLWGVAAALAAFVAGLHRLHRKGLLLFAALSVALLADDTLLLHEVVGPRLRVPELLFFAAYACAGVVLALLLSPSRAGAAGWAMLGSGALLAGSILTDVVVSESFLAEDGLKLVGTALWVTVPVLAHLQVQRPQVHQAFGGSHAASRPPVGLAATVDLREAPSEDAGVPASARASR